MTFPDASTSSTSIDCTPRPRRQYLKPSGRWESNSRSCSPPAGAKLSRPSRPTPQGVPRIHRIGHLRLAAAFSASASTATCVSERESTGAGGQALAAWENNTTIGTPVSVDGT